MLIVSPHEGAALQTNFKFSALFWDDVDLPLTYEWLYSAGSSSPLIIKSRSDNQFHTTVLPAADTSPTRANVTVFLNVYDVKDAFTTVNASVVVFVVDFNMEQLEAFYVNIRASNSTEKTVIGAVMVMKTMLYIDCSLADDCTAKNRHECSSTVNTCGYCLPGFVGEAGHSNSSCMSHATIDEAFNLTCSLDGDCFSWETCSTATSQCFVRSKQCIDNCSGQGSCFFLDAFSGLPLDSCAVDASTCVSRCVCDAGFDGSVCDVNSTVFERRKVVIESLSSQILSFGQSETTMSQAFVSSVITEPKYLKASIDIKDSVLALQSKTLTSHIDDVYTFVENPFTVFEALADLSIELLPQSNSSRRLMESSYGESAISDHILQIFGIFSSEIVGGQFPMEYVYSHYAYGYYAPLARQKHYNVSAPMSSLQPLRNAPRRFELTFLQAEIDTKLGVVSINQIVYQQQLLSDVCQLYIRDPTSCKGSQCEVMIKFPHYGAIPFNTSVVTDVISVSCARDVPSREDVVCSSGKSTVVECSGIPGVFRIQCKLTLVTAAVSMDEASSTSVSCSPTSTSELESSFICRIQNSDTSESAITVVRLVAKEENASSVIIDFTTFYPYDVKLPFQLTLVFGFLWSLWVFVFLVKSYRQQKDQKKVKCETDALMYLPSVDGR